MRIPNSRQDALERLVEALAAFDALGEHAVAAIIAHALAVAMEHGGSQSPDVPPAP